jgi:large conductance mechanosensitive channel
MGLFHEFKTFIQRGNVIDLAVAVIIGAAFGQIVTSLVNDILTPVIGIATQGGVPAVEIELINGAKIKLGSFLQAVLNFFVIAFCVFMIVKGINAVHLPKLLTSEPKPVELTTQEKLLTEIRDLLKSKADIK